LAGGDCGVLFGGRQAKHKEDTATRKVNIILSLCLSASGGRHFRCSLWPLHWPIPLIVPRAKTGVSCEVLNGTCWSYLSAVGMIAEALAKAGSWLKSEWQ
jgi:hypothetical protein